jgi:hypothetical protein
MRHELSNPESNLVIANAAKRELLAANRDHLVLLPVSLMNHCVDP